MTVLVVWVTEHAPEWQAGKHNLPAFQHRLYPCTGEILAGRLVRMNADALVEPAESADDPKLVGRACHEPMSEVQAWELAEKMWGPLKPMGNPELTP
jgi:hypothetical protein